MEQVLLIIFITCNPSNVNWLEHHFISNCEGMAGVTAAKKLTDEGVHDFVVVEGSDRVRRRKHLFVSSSSNISDIRHSCWLRWVGGLKMFNLVE